MTEHNQESVTKEYVDGLQTVYTLKGAKFLIRVPERSGNIVGIISCRDGIIIACVYGDIYKYDLDTDTLRRISVL